MWPGPSWREFDLFRHRWWRRASICDCSHQRRNVYGYVSALRPSLSAPVARADRRGVLTPGGLRLRATGMWCFDARPFDSCSEQIAASGRFRASGESGVPTTSSPRRQPERGRRHLEPAGAPTRRRPRGGVQQLGQRDTCPASTTTVTLLGVDASAKVWDDTFRVTVNYG